MYKVRFTPKAEQQKYELLRYVAEELFNEDAVMNVENAFDKVIGSLKIFPTTGTIHEIIGGVEIRKKVVKSYLLFYVVEQEQKLVTIFSVKHSLHNN